MPQTLTFTIESPSREEWDVVTNGGTDLTVGQGGTIVLASAAVGIVTINLPAASDNLDRVIVVKKTDSTSNRVIIDPNGSETIDGETTAEIDTQFVAITVASDGANWHIV